MQSASEYYRSLTLDNYSPFRPAQVKLKRAQRHIIEVRDMARALPQRAARLFSYGTCRETGHLQITFISHNPMPLEFAAAVGDAIHCLRTTFDYLAVALTAPPIGRGQPNKTYFPTGLDPMEFLKARDGFVSSNGKKVPGRMEGAPRKALLLVETLEPYDGGKHNLRALHQLDIFDKHKLILSAIEAATIHRMSVLVDGEEYIIKESDFQSNEDGTNTLVTVDVPYTHRQKFDFGQDFDASYEIVFDKEQPLAGSLIIESLTEFARVAGDFIAACEAEFHGYARTIR